MRKSVAINCANEGLFLVTDNHDFDDHSVTRYVCSLAPPFHLTTLALLAGIVEIYEYAFML